MADRLVYSVSVSPQELLTDEQSNSYWVVSGEVGKSLGCSGISVVTDYANTAAAQGYLNATVNYAEVIDSATQSVSTETTASGIFIKNTGYTFSSATALGAALTASLEVKCGSTRIALLDAGEGIFLKDDNATLNGTALNVRTMSTVGTANTGIGHLAMEYLVTD